MMLISRSQDKLDDVAMSLSKCAQMEHPRKRVDVERTVDVFSPLLQMCAIFPFFKKVMRAYRVFVLPNLTLRVVFILDDFRNHLFLRGISWKQELSFLVHVYTFGK